MSFQNNLNKEIGIFSKLITYHHKIQMDIMIHIDSYTDKMDWENHSFNRSCNWLLQLCMLNKDMCILSRNLDQKISQ